jgi:hypothetical protein
VPRLTQYTASNGVENRTILEARCGTTTQRDEYPYQLLAKMPRTRPQLERNTLILHRVIERANSIFWRSDIFWRSSTRGFVDTSDHVSALLPKQLSAEVKIRNESETGDA